MSTEQKTIILGDEYDDALRDALRATLVKHGAIGLDKTWGVGGSQEIETLKVKVENELITVESETFVGLTITGSKALVESLAKQVHEMIKR